MARTLHLTLMLVLFVSTGCDRAPRELEPEREQRPSPSPSPLATFELEGSVIEASGSAAVEVSPATGPARQTPASPTARGTPSPGGETPSPGDTAAAVTRIERGAPGSIAVRLVRYVAEETACTFNENDVLVIAFTTGTTFEPTEVTDRRDFPNNLRGSVVRIEGRIIEEEQHCLLVANVVQVGQDARTQSPAPGRPRSPAPTPRTTPSPTA